MVREWILGQWETLDFGHCVLFRAPLYALEKIWFFELNPSCVLAVAFVKTQLKGKLKLLVSLLILGLFVIPSMTNSYVCHFNLQPIYKELKCHKMNIVGRITTVLCVVVYTLTAISGYFDSLGRIQNLMCLPT